MNAITGQTLQLRLQSLKQELRDIKIKNYTNKEYKLSKIEEVELYIKQLQEDIEILKKC